MGDRGITPHQGDAVQRHSSRFEDSYSLHGNALIRSKI